MSGLEVMDLSSIPVKTVLFPDDDPSHGPAPRPALPAPSRLDEDMSHTLEDASLSPFLTPTAAVEVARRRADAAPARPLRILIAEGKSLS